MGFQINSKSCGDIQLFLAKRGCRADVFRTFKGVLIVGSNFELDAASNKTLLDQILEAQYAEPNRRVYFVPFQNIVSVAGGDLRTTARPDGFPTSIEENVPVIGAALTTDFKTIYMHKQLRKLNNRFVKFYAVTENNLILGETNSTGTILKPVDGLLWRYLYLPQAEGGGGEAADLTMYYESANSLGDDIAFAALPEDVRLDRDMQQLAELKIVIAGQESGALKLKLILAVTGEDVTAELGAAIGAMNAGIIVTSAATGADITGLTTYAAATATIDISGIAATGLATVSLAQPQALIDGGVGSVEDGSYAADPIKVMLA